MVFDLVRMISFAMETGVKCCGISVDTQLRVDVTRKVINKKKYRLGLSTEKLGTPALERKLDENTHFVI